MPKREIKCNNFDGKIVNKKTIDLSQYNEIILPDSTTNDWKCDSCLVCETLDRYNAMWSSACDICESHIIICDECKEKEKQYQFSHCLNCKRNNKIEEVLNEA